MKRLDFPISRITLDLTERCNLGCRYCFTYGRGRRDLTWEQGKKTIDWLFSDEISQGEQLEIQWWGGEPFLKFDLMKRLNDYAANKAVKEGRSLITGGTTNATLLTKEVVDWMCQTRCYFMLSIDGPGEIQDKYRPMRNGRSSWEEIKKNLPYIKEKIPFIRSRMAPTPETIGKLTDSIKYLYENYGIEYNMFSPVYEYDWTDEAIAEAERQFKLLADFMIEKKLEGKPIEIKHFDDGVRALYWKKNQREHPCGAGRFYVGISIDGYIYPCLSGDTKISLLDGRELTIPEMIQEGKSEYWVYSCTEDGKIVPGRAINPRKTGHKQVVKVTLDNGESFKCTPDHLLMLRGGGYWFAEECEGLSLMPLYRRLNYKGYEEFQSNYNGKWYPTHMMVSEYFEGKLPKGWVTHHIEIGNIRNNEPSNLIQLPFKLHGLLHSHLIRETNRLGITGWGAAYKNPEYRIRMFEIHSRQMTKLNNELRSNPEYVKYHSEVHSKLARDGKIGYGLFWKKNRNYIDKMLLLAKEGKIGWQAVRNRHVENINDLMYLMGMNYTKENYDYCRKIYITGNKFHPQLVPIFNNHKVVSIEPAGYEDVYDITVEEYHNFAISSGIFVHNCHRFNKYDGRKNRLILGHIDDPDIITNPELRSKMINFLDIKIDKCENCEWFRKLCHASCYAINYDITGDIANPPDSHCKWQGALSRGIIYYYEQLIKHNLPVVPNQGGGKKMQSCVCYNMCYLEGTPNEIRTIDKSSGMACHCYNTSYAGGLNDQARVLTDEEKLKSETVSCGIHSEVVDFQKKMYDAMVSLDSSIKKLCDLLEKKTK